MKPVGPALRPEVPDGDQGQLYTYSRMLRTINRQMGDIGNVEVKKQGTDGAYYPVNETDVAMVDLKMKVTQIAKGLKDMSADQKLEFSRQVCHRDDPRISRFLA